MTFATQLTFQDGRRAGLFVPAFLDDWGLTPNETRVYQRVCRRAGSQGECFESMDNIAKGCKLSRATIWRALKALVSFGFLSKTKRHNPRTGGNMTNLYTVNDFPDEMTEQQQLEIRSKVYSRKRSDDHLSLPSEPGLSLPPKPDLSLQVEQGLSLQGKHEGSPKSFKVSNSRSSLKTHTSKRTAYAPKPNPFVSESGNTSSRLFESSTAKCEARFRKPQRLEAPWEGQDDYSQFCEWLAKQYEKQPLWGASFLKNARKDPDQNAIAVEGYRLFKQQNAKRGMTHEEIIAERVAGFKKWQEKREREKTRL